VDPAGHHLVSVALHALNAALFFLVLEAMTGFPWPSAFAALLFALHPLHVESVVWVSERKDVLSTSFGLLAMAAYGRYARRPDASRMACACLLFACSLMAKPMLVTLPFLFLVLDAWPLDRVGPGGPGPVRLAAEKLPLLALSAAASVLAVVAQSRGQAIMGMEQLPLLDRLGGALVSYAEYLLKCAWPARLSVHYPIAAGGPPAWKIAASAALLAAVTIAAVRARARKPWLLAGWLWFLGTLVPVIGLVQIGAQSMADRYTYFPLAGIFVAVAFEMREWAGRLPFGRVAVPCAAAALLAAIVPATERQIGYWASDVSLFRHAVETTSGNWKAHYNLGYALLLDGDAQGAEQAFRSTLAIWPGYADAQLNLGTALAAQKRFAEAIPHFREALRLSPGDARAARNLATALSILEGDRNRNQASPE
jgi:tetratricopeptide (TPR) repeat protein